MILLQERAVTDAKVMLAYAVLSIERISLYELVGRVTSSLGSSHRAYLSAIEATVLGAHPTVPTQGHKTGVK